MKVPGSGGKVGAAGQPFGASNQLARPAARPRSPLALILPIMNIIAGLPVPVIELEELGRAEHERQVGGLRRALLDPAGAVLDDDGVGVAAVARVHR